MGAGVPPGLQNLCWRDERLGGFDSHIFPPNAVGLALYILLEKDRVCGLFLGGSECVGAEKNTNQLYGGG